MYLNDNDLSAFHFVKNIQNNGTLSQHESLLRVGFLKANICFIHILVTSWETQVQLHQVH